MPYYTKSINTKVYSAKGTDIATIAAKDVLVTVSGRQVEIGERGVCFPVSAPKVGFIPVDKLRVTASPTPDPIPNPPPPIPVPMPEPIGNVRKLRIWGDPVTLLFDRDINKVGVTNWQNFPCYNELTGWGAIDKILWIPKEDIQKLRSIQIADSVRFSDGRVEYYSQDKKMDWLIRDKGSIYIKTPNWRTAEKAAWGTTAIGGNYVRVAEYRKMTVPHPIGKKPWSTEMARLVGFRKADWQRKENQTNAEWLIEMQAKGLVHRAFCVYKNNQFGDSPKGIVYSPFWSPLDYVWGGKNKSTALWLPTVWFED